MSLPMKDLPLSIRPRTHRDLLRIAKARGGITLSQVGREIIEQYVASKIHESKIILGQQDDDLEQGELDLDAPESHRNTRSGRR